MSTLDFCLAKLVDMMRYFEGGKPTPSLLIVDSKSVQNADTAREKGYDAGKKLRARSFTSPSMFSERPTRSMRQPQT